MTVAVIAAASLVLISAVILEPGDFRGIGGSVRESAMPPRGPEQGSGRGLVEAIGSWARRMLGRRPNAGFDRRGGRILVGAGIAAFAGLPVAAAGAVGGYAFDIQRRRSAARRDELALATGLADVLDLFRITITSGANLLVAIQTVAPWLPGRYGQSFNACLAEVERGSSLVESLERIPHALGPQIRPLVAALVASERYGAPIGDGLRLLAVESRADRRRQAERAARRLPVAMVFPLVVCVLPAFMLLTVVPVVIEVIGRFRGVGFG